MTTVKRALKLSNPC
ncbi:hypothetical protein MTR67_039351 [Solanum verrucosum]|uniref:Uncharacterized protein n=1 Tax=Solanum verrucosum TaxID=315347 RepID=A0AAF0UHX7_SOLVR|nr:hypothetical protein MTR67_039351 [Solanum verrucosum]